jgi:hypothetical protein
MRILLTITLLLTLSLGFAQQDLCLSDDEIALGNLINNMRTSNDLSVLPFSASLTYVADLHVKDLYLNYDRKSGCSLLSWSENGRWTPCCVDDEDLECMQDKPFELTDYKSKGYELVFFANTNVTSGLAFNAWRNTEAAKNLILQKGKYSKKQWNAMGVAIFEGYVSVWFGELIDKAGEPLTCDEAERQPDKSRQVATEEIEKNPQGYYVVVASRKRKKDAEKEVENRQESGVQFQIVESGDNYRVVTGPFSGYSQALIVKQKLSDGKNKPWIWKADEK